MVVPSEGVGLLLMVCQVIDPSNDIIRLINKSLAGKNIMECLPKNYNFARLDKSLPDKINNYVSKKIIVARGQIIKILDADSG